MKRKVLAHIGLFAAAFAWTSTASAHPGAHHDVERLTEQIEAAPDKVELWIERAYFLRLDEKFDAALADLDQAERLSPGQPEIAAHRGFTLEAMGRDAEAEHELTRFLEATSGTATAYAARGRIHERAGRLAQSADDYASAIALTPDVALYLIHGELLERLDRSEQAAVNYRDGMTRLGDAVTLRQALIRVETGRGNFAAALALVDEALQRNANSVDWRLARGDILAAAERSDEAQRERLLALEQAERLIQKRMTAINLVTRAKVYTALGRIDDARKDLKLAIKRAPRYEPARKMLEQLAVQPPRE